MSSAPDETQRSEPLKDILGLTSANPAGRSVVDSIQTLRNLAHELSLAEITETEKKAKQVLEQLGALQETLKRIKQLRLHFHPLSPQSQPEAKPKNSSKASAANVIPFPLFTRSSEVNTSSEASVVPKVSVADAEEKSERYPSRHQGSRTAPDKPDLKKLREQLSAAWSVKPSEKAERDRAERSPPGEEGVLASYAPSDPEPQVHLHVETFGQVDTPNPNEPEPTIPELVIPDEEPARKKEFALPSKRIAVDAEIKELVKNYGQVDIYSHRESDGRENLRKAALAGFILIAVLAVSYFFLH